MILYTVIFWPYQMHADIFGIIIQIACALLAYDSVYSCTVVLQSAYMFIFGIIMQLTRALLIYDTDGNVYISVLCHDKNACM